VSCRRPLGTAGGLRERAEYEEWVLRRDAVFLEARPFTKADSVSAEKFGDVFGNHVAAVKKGTAHFILEIAFDVEVGTLWIDEHAGGRIVDEKRHVAAFVHNLLPLAIISRFPQLPDHRAVVVAGLAGDPGGNCLGAFGQAADFDQSHSRAANL